MALLSASRNLHHVLIMAILSLFCLNVIALSVLGNYEIRWGWIHLTASGIFKPLLMMNGCFILALMICRASTSKYSDKTPGFGEKILHSTAACSVLLPALLISLLLALYSGSAAVNFSDHDWNHRHISAGIDSMRSVGELFTTPQADGFYRPLTFISLWMDYQLFGTSYAGYHIQSIAFHGINALLVAWLALTLGFSRVHSMWAGLLFVAAAVNFEAVLWPAARFDLLATMFTLMALITGVKYFKNKQLWSWALPASLLSYAAGIMNKESSYSFPLLLLFVLYTHRLWSIPRPNRRKVIICCILLAAVTTAMISVRFAVYDGLGGYPTQAGQESAHFKIELKTLESLIRTVPLSMLGVNTSSASPTWLRIILVMFSFLIFVSALAGCGRFKQREYALLVCALIASLPVMNFIIWIGTTMQHCRYLYMTAVFVMLLIVSTLGKIRWSAVLLGAFLAMNALGTLSNIWIYRDMLVRTESLAESVRLDWLEQPTVRTIALVDVPDSPSGVFFFANELVGNLKRKIPDAKIIRQKEQDQKQFTGTSLLAYKWNDTDRVLERVQ